MTISHQFGGSWTQDKLNRIEKYLNAYMTIMTKNPRAKYYKTIYVDAFAGPGYRKIKKINNEFEFPLFDDEAGDLLDWTDGNDVIVFLSLMFTFRLFCLNFF